MTTGRIVKRNGKWAYVISLPYDPMAGKYPQKWKSGFEKKKDAQEALQQAMVTIDMPSALPSLTVRDFLLVWMEQTVKGKCTPRTEKNYQNSINTTNQALGNILLAKLEPNHIENFYTSLSARLSSSSVHTIHRTLRAALNRAVKLGYLKESPMVRVDAPSLRTPRRSTLSVQQATTILKWMQIHRPASHVGAYLAVFSGMRRGEICGLQWKDIDRDNCVISIVRTRQRIDGKQIIGTPKTDLSTRSVPVSKNVIDLLQNWRQRRETWVGQPLQEDDWVLTQLDGFPVDPDTLTHDLRKAEVTLDMPKVSFHDLRHTHATILLESGVDLKTVSYTYTREFERKCAI